MKQLLALSTRVLTRAALILSVCASLAHAQGAPTLSGLAAFEQLRKEYYIGALYLGWPGHDTATILAMPGKRQMELRVTADRWPALRFAQMWNQAITINADGSALNASAMDILAFTSIPKGDLLAGDHLVIESDPTTGTRVTLNGVLVQTTKNNGLFNLVLSAWIGARPPSSEFKRDMLTLPTTAAGTALAARFESIRPSDARKKAVAAWGIKPEPETAVAAAAAPVAAKPADAPKPAEPPKAAAPITPATAAAPAPGRPVPTPAKPVPEAARPAPAPEPVRPIAPAAPDPAALAAASQARMEKEQQQADLYNQYLGQVRKQVLKNIDYPRRAQKEGVEGLVVLRINIDRSGGVTGSEVAQSAHELLDAAAENAVRKAAPYPKPPEQLEGEQFQILVPVVFKFQ
jgi:periplasmic protein TonB